MGRAIQEIARFVATVRPVERDIHGPAHLGDLPATACSTFNRNREFGNRVGKVLHERMVPMMGMRLLSDHLP